MANALNQYASVNGTTFAYDGRGNLQSDAARSFTYDPENRLLTASGSGIAGVTLTYDPLGRLQTSAAGGATKTLLYSGSDLVGEYDASGTILARTVPGSGVDDPLVWYSGPGVSTRWYPHADVQGSIVVWSNNAGGLVGSQGYDPYGQPANWAAGNRYGYTGQIMIPEAHLYDFEARMYDPALGRFLQTDPLGQGPDVNLYAYVGDDPVNGWDPSGLASAQCDLPDCHWVDFGGGGYEYDNGSTTITCSVGSFEGGGASNGDCTAARDLGSSGFGGYGSNGPSLAGPNGGGKEIGGSPRPTICTSTGSAFSTAVSGVGATHEAMFNGAAAALRQSGLAADAGALGGAALPLSVGLTVAGEGYDASQEYAQGQSLGRVALVHGGGALGGGFGGFGGAELGFWIGEALFPAGGGVPGAIIGGLIGGLGGSTGGHAPGKAAASRLAPC